MVKRNPVVISGRMQERHRFKKAMAAQRLTPNTASVSVTPTMLMVRSQGVSCDLGVWSNYVGCRIENRQDHTSFVFRVDSASLGRMIDKLIEFKSELQSR